MADGGHYPAVSDREILATFENREDEWLRAEDVAAELPVRFDDRDDERRLEDRLDDLTERGLLERDEGGLPGLVWRLDPEAPDDATGAADAEPVETDVEAQAAKTTDAATPPRDEETPADPPPDPQATDETIEEQMPDAIRAFDPPGTPEEKARRRGALHQAYVYLRRRGRATREDLDADVFPGASGVYEAPDDGWWSEGIRPGFDRRPVAEPVEGSDDEEWTYTGEKPAETD
jgi:hypothetical protein